MPENEVPVTHVPASAWTLLPPAPDACQVCARRHDANEPHDAQSLYWATKRAMEGKPAPTWAEALEHVEPDVRAAWVTALGEHGVTVDVDLDAAASMEGGTA